MPGTFSNIVLHIVFGTKNRQRLITTDLRPRIYKYMGGIIRQSGGALYEIGGLADHVHLLVQSRPGLAVSDLVRTVKSGSSGWAHREHLDVQRFGWREGYGVFSVSQSRVDTLKRYIVEQEEHHKRRDFKSEFLALLEAHGVEYDEQYVLD